jgi:hypothetical protein
VLQSLVDRKSEQHEGVDDLGGRVHDAHCGDHAKHRPMGLLRQDKLAAKSNLLRNIRSDPRLSDRSFALENSYGWKALRCLSVLPSFSTLTGRSRPTLYTHAA